MEDKYKQYITIVIAWVIILAVGVSLVGFTGAQETGEGSASIEYDYDNTQINYELNGELFEPYRMQALSEPESSGFTQADGSTDATHIQWANSGSILYWSNGEGTIYQLDVSESYNLDTLTSIDSTTVPSATGSDPIDDFQIGNDGQELYYSIAGNRSLFQTSFGTAYDINTIGPTNDHSDILPFGAGDTFTFEIVNDGQRFYVFGLGQTETVYYGNMSTSWDISTLPIGLDYTYIDIGPVYDIEYIDDGQAIVDSAMYNGLTKISFSSDFSSISAEYTKDVGSMDSFTWSDSGQVLFTSRSDTGTDLVLDKYDANEYSATIENEEGEEIKSIDSIEQTGNITYSPEVTQYGIQLYWNAVTDTSYSGSSDTIDIYINNEMSIRNEQTNNLITDVVNVTAYGEDSGIYSLDTSSGTIDITDLPGQSYTFVVSADGYTQRVRYVDQLGTVENLYLLDNSTSRVTTQFSLEDRTGTYDQDSRLVIRRSIPGDGNDWETIISDQFGTGGLTVELEEDIRYRLYVETNTQMQLIGSYTATLPETVTISPSSGEIDVGGGEYWSAGANYGEQDLDVRFVDPTEETDSVNVTIYERGNESNVLVSGDSYTNPSELQLEYAVSDQYNESNWIVELTVERGAETYTTSFNVGPTADIVPTELDSFWRKIFGVMLMLTFGMIFSIRNKAVGSIVYACVGGMLYWIGLLEGLTTGGLIVGYFFIVIIYNIYLKS